MVKVVIEDAFSLRPGDTVAFGDMERMPRMNGDYALMVLDVPALPQPSHSVCMPVTVLCAQFIGGTWRWVPLAPTTKDALLLIAESVPLTRGVWHVMCIGTGEPQIAVENQPSPRAAKEGGAS